MNNTISDSLLYRFSEFVAAQIGLYFSERRLRDLERGIRSSLQEFGFKDTESCIKWLLSSPLTKNQIEILASHLTVGETYFFRDNKSFEVLADHILPELIHRRKSAEKSLRIWSAGCATGQEPYSIAILLNKLIYDPGDWNLTIMGTDINPSFLQKASEGIYSDWSFRDTPRWVKEGYFRKTKQGHFEISPSIRKLVKFSYLNLIDDAYPSLTNNTNAMDVIFCRNVLMYFDQERQKKVIQNLSRCLVDGGYLIVSPSETSHVLFSELRMVNLDGVIFYKKESGKFRTAEDFICEDILYHPTFEKAAYSVQPPLEYVAGQESEISFPQKSGQALQLETGIIGIQKTQPQLTPYEEALALYKQGRYGEAVDKIRLLLSNNKIDYEAFALLARAYANMGKLSEAMEWCKKAIVEDKMNPGCHYLLATIQQEQGHVEETVKSLRRALYLDQSFVLAYFALGNLTRQQGKFKEAKKYFENALSLLSAYRQEDILPESDGITAGRLIEIIQTIMRGENANERKVGIG
jgi:chemotaxis protein methyltransferase CheR